MPQQNWVTMVLIYVVFFGALYFIFMRPQQKKEKNVRAMREALKPGDNITTIGGIMGTVLTVKEDYITVEVGADKTKLKFAKWAVGSVEKKDKENKDSKDSK